ncbi:piggyBac transposable element-derived protein 3-like [Lineus longissimus]|uniref:piggyBac transposable element-derived protein 3-like n=1 Tax=Lineus longissimus TaxID=88925 RepID=UPI00315C948E
MDEAHNVQYQQFLGDSAHGPTEPLDCSSPVEFFEQVWPDALIHGIVEETNRYAGQQGRMHWHDTTFEEIKAFQGVLVLMGIHIVPAFKDYFSSDELLSVPAVTKVFPKNRFFELRGNLHLADNETAVPRDDPNYDKLYKLRPLLNTLQTTFRQYFEPGQNCAVDEHMVKGKGRYPCKQYMPAKPIKRGTKIWELGCSCCAYIYAFQIYTGAEGNREHGLSHRVVMDLARTLNPMQNHVIYIDNFFSSFPLLKNLNAIGIFGCGTPPHSAVKRYTLVRC